VDETDDEGLAEELPHDDPFAGSDVLSEEMDEHGRNEVHEHPE
jgi:hypothetical protein